MAVGSPPTVRRRQLGRELRKLREDAGLHIDQLAESLHCSPSRISRIETARIRISPGTVHEILDVLEIHDERRGRLVGLAREAEEPGWWQQYGDVLGHTYAAYIALEAEASRLYSHEPLIVHGLLQTEEYAHAIIAKSHRMSTVDTDGLVAARMARQVVVTRKDPLQLDVLLAEEALHRQIGGENCMRAQLRHLVELGQRPNVRLRMLPFAVGALATMAGAFSILEFPDEPGVVYLENVASDMYLESPQALSLCTSVYAALAADALSVEESLAFIDVLAGR